jgi:hypothetical protein
VSIVIDPTAPPPVPPVEVTSPDGILTARRDDTWAGVVLTADYTDADPVPGRVRLVHAGPDGIEVPVRSGDLAWAPGGLAVAYDHEAPLGAPVTWYAYPVAADGTLGARSQGAALTIPEPGDSVRDVWLKSLTDPAASLRVLVLSWPVLEYGARQQRLDILGAASPVISVDAWALGSGEASILTETLAERAALLGLLKSGSVLLAQTRGAYGRPDAYLVPGTVSEQMAGDATDPGRIWTVSLTAVDRPPTLDAGLRIPGRSYADTGRALPTYADRTATGQTYHQTTVGG